MTIGLVWNNRDSDMIELVGKNSKGEWAYVWGIFHTDMINDAVQGELQGDRTFRELVECVIISKADWDHLLSTLEQADQELKAAEDKIAYLLEEAQ
jgi:hypothetical protein